jgi:N-acetylglucosamine malate deacetylase 1
MTGVLVVAPHPDDETLGCGGTLLRHRAQGDQIHWLIVTDMSVGQGYSSEQVLARGREIETVRAAYGFSSTTNLKLPAAALDTIPMAQLVRGIAETLERIQPATLFVPFSGDIHTDHRITFSAVISASKWFRARSIKKILTYEVLSETDAAIAIDAPGFRPNVFVDVSKTLDDKIRIMKLYGGELGEFPFPRSEKAIRALACVRGAAAGLEAAESFVLLKEIV